MTTRRLIRLPEVMNKTGYSKAWIYRLISRGVFPEPIKNILLIRRGGSHPYIEKHNTLLYRESYYPKRIKEMNNDLVDEKELEYGSVIINLVYKK